MNSHTGETYPTRFSAEIAGVRPLDIVEVFGDAHAVGRVKRACRSAHLRRERLRKAQKASRKANRRG